MNSFSPMLGLHYICPSNSSKTNNMKRSLFLVTLLLSIVLPAFADDFSYQDGRASLSPYPTDRVAREFPDSLTPIFVNHVGRHGSRYPAGSLHTMMMKRALDKADSLNTITPLGKQLLEEVDAVIETTAGRWGALDSIGESEHRNIAERLFRSCPELLDSARVVAISSYSPRSIKSMYAFLHRLTELSSNIDATAASGRRFNPLMRNFDEDEAYKSFRTDTAYLATYNRFLSGNITIDPLFARPRRKLPARLRHHRRPRLGGILRVGRHERHGADKRRIPIFHHRRIPQFVVDFQLPAISALFRIHAFIPSGRNCSAIAARHCHDRRQRIDRKTPHCRQVPFRPRRNTHALARIDATSRMPLSDKLFRHRCRRMERLRIVSNGCQLATRLLQSAVGPHLRERRPQ